MPTQPDPPQWLMMSFDALSIVSSALLIMYLFNKLECNKFVRLTLGIQVGMLALAIVAYYRVGGFGGR